VAARETFSTLDLPSGDSQLRLIVTAPLRQADAGRHHDDAVKKNFADRLCAGSAG
jgi:hypothetical protein